MRRLQTVIAGLGLLYLALLIGTNLGCAPKYFLRADVLAGLAITVCALGLLAFAVGGDGAMFCRMSVRSSSVPTSSAARDRAVPPTKPCVIAHVRDRPDRRVTE